MLDVAMALSWLSACLLATLVVYVTPFFNEELCTLQKESKGLIPPPLPRNFESWAEQVDNRENYTTYTETYLDYTNNRGKYMYTMKGIEHHFLYDYETQQIVEWAILHPGLDVKKDPMSQTCTAVPMDDSPDIFIFGLQDEMSKRPKMYNANEMMRYGGQYQYSYSGTDRLTHRGLLVDKFTGCVYDRDMDATMSINYAFTNSTVLPSGGTLMSDVLGVDEGLLSVPVRADMFTTMFDANANKTVSLNKTEHFFWFKGEPEFKRETFQIPPYMYCNNYRGRKNMNSFPRAFSTRVQRVDLARDIFGKMAITEVASYEEIFYYREKNLARRDFTPNPNLDTDIKSKFQSLDPVKTIFDFNEGIVYITNKPTGRCYARPITFGDFFESSNDTMYILMANPEEIFFMQSDEMEYKGTDFTRDIECDVWTGKYFDKRFNASFVKETYVSTNGWHEESNQLLEYGVPVQHTMMNQELGGDAVEVISTYSFLKFMNTPPLLEDFDISNCIETTYHKDFVLFLVDNKKINEKLFTYKSQFLETAQYYITAVSQVATPLRVQRLTLTQLSITDKRTVVHFTLVDKTVLSTDVPVGQSGAGLDEAAAILQGFIDKNLFTIQFYIPGDKEPTPVSARSGSLYIKTASGELEAPPSRKEQIAVDPVNEEIPVVVFVDNPQENGDGTEKNKGLSSGALAGLAFAMLFIGIGIGIAVMYLYIRRYSMNSLEDRITLTPQVSLSNDAGGSADTGFSQ